MPRWRVWVDGMTPGIIEADDWQEWKNLTVFIKGGRYIRAFASVKLQWLERLNNDISSGG